MIDVPLISISPFIQYPIAVLIFLLSLKNFNKINRTDLVIVLLLLNLGALSYSLGILRGYTSNIRAILVPIIFIVIINSNSHKYLKPLFIYCLLILILEYIIYYSGFVFFRQLSRFGLLRPYGGLFDTHSSSLFMAVSLYLFGFPILGGVIAIFMMTLQTPIAYAVLLLKKKNIVIFMIFISITIFALYKIGHLDPNNRLSMMTAYLLAFDFNYDYCYLLGCASNNIEIEGLKVALTVNLKKFGIIADNGPVRTLFFFGIPWLFFYFMLLSRNCKSKALPILYFVTIFHYPVSFGIVNTAVIAISINYFNNIKYFNRFKISKITKS
jgi:hypothetical protein